MRLVPCAAGLIVLLAAVDCQGNIGTGGGLPQPPGPQITPIAGAQSRTRTTEGAVFLDGDTKSIPLPEVGGFAVAIALASPTPSPSPSPSASPQSGPRLTTAAPPATPSATPSTKPRSALAANERPKAAATPSGPKIDTKTTIYPEDAPAAPTPQPTGNVQSYAHRTPLVRGWIMPRAPLTLYSLAAVRFTIPAQEQTKARGFTIALFESLKHRKTHLLAWDPAAALADNAVSAAAVASEPIALKKNVGYYFVLYGDDLGPVPIPSGSFPPANNPLLGSPTPGTSIATPPAIPGVAPVPTPTPLPH